MIIRELTTRFIAYSKPILIVIFIFTSSIGGMIPVPPLAQVLAQEDSTRDESRPYDHLYLGKISGVQFSGTSAQEGGISEFGGKPDWIQSGFWMARLKSSGEDLTAGFQATIDMIKPDGSALHRHIVNNFQLSNFSASEDNSTHVLVGTATVTMTEGPISGVPLTLKVHDESLIEILIGPGNVSGHFGTNPLYGTFTFAKTSFLDTGESETKQFPNSSLLPSQALGQRSLQRAIWLSRSEKTCIGLQMARIIPCFLSETMVSPL